MLEEYKNKYNQLKGKRDIIQQSIDDTSKELRQEKRNLKNIETAQVIIQKVAQQTQQELEFHISDVVSTALAAVFDNPYEFIVRFETKRNKTEARLLFKRDGQEINPITSSGIGAVDVASFALRIALWSLKKPKNRNTLILDENFKHLKGEEENKKVIEMIKLLSEKLGLQIIMVHDERISLSEIEKGADKIFKVNMKKGISEVVELK